MQESEYVVRNGRKVIDVQKSIHAFCMALGRQVEKETKIRDNKDYKKVIRSIFKRYPGAVIAKPALIALSLQAMNAMPDNYNSLHRELDEHIRLNSGIYLDIQRGKCGGVRLIVKGKVR